MTLIFAIQKRFVQKLQHIRFTFFVCIIYPQYKYAYVHNYSAHGIKVGVFVRTQTRIYNLILISASYYYAPCMALALVLYCV